MDKRVLFVVAFSAVLTSCGTPTATSVPTRADTANSQHRAVRTLSGSGSGHFKLVVGAKQLPGGGCDAGADQWYLPNSTFVTLAPSNLEAFYSLSTLVLTSTSPVTFTSSEPAGASAYLGVSSSSSSYVAAGSWFNNVWTPPSAGTYYAGFVQEWTVNDGCSQYTEYDGTLSLSWTQ